VAAGVPLGSTYGTPNAISTSINAISAAGTYYYRALVGGNSGCDAQVSTPVSLTVVADPGSSTPAFSNGTICVGGTSNVSVTASNGTGTYTYQWQYSTTLGGVYANVLAGTPAGSTYTNATTSNMTIAGISAAGASYYYRCVVGSTGSGCNTMTSGGALLTVVADPAISVQPVAGSICVGGTYAPTVTATGGTPSLTYQWQYSPDNITFSNVTNGTPAGSTYTNPTSNNTFSVAGISAAGTYYYRCQASAAGNGCGTATSTAAALTVSADPSITAQSMSNGTICLGGTSTASVTVSGGSGTTYQWQYSADNVTFSNVAAGVPLGSTYGTPNAISTTINAISAAGTYYYRALVGGNSGCDAQVSTPVSLTVVADPSSSTPAFSNGTICVGGTSNVSVTASNGTGTYTYQWQYSTTLGGVYANVLAGTPAGSTYTNATTSNMTIAGISAAGASYYYRCVVGSTGSGCNTMTSGGALLTVVADPAISVQPVAGSICVGGTYAPTVTATGGTPSLTYQWQYSPDNITFSNVTNGTPVGSTYNNPTSNNTFSVAGISAAGTYYYRCQASAAGNGCGTATSTAAALTVSSDPSFTTQTIAPAAICPGGSSTATVAVSGGSGTTYQWQYSPNNSTWSNVAAGTPTGSTYGTPNAASTTINAISAAGTYYYRCMIGGNNGCDGGVSSSLTLTVTPEPASTVPTYTVNPICTGGSSVVSVTASNGTGTYTYQWQYSTALAGTYANVIAGTPAGSTYTNATSSAMTIAGITAAGSAYYYRCIVGATGSGCDAANSTGAQFVVNVTPAAPQAVGNVTLGPVANASVIAGSNILADCAVTASHCYVSGAANTSCTCGTSTSTIPPWAGRLFNPAATNCAWAGDVAAAGKTWTLDLGSVKPVNGVVTQGRGDAAQYVTSYTVSTSYDGTTFTPVNGTFTGNTNNTTAVVNMFGQYHARYVRITVSAYTTFPSMRIDVISIPEESSAGTYTVNASAEIVSGANTVRWYSAATGGTLLGTGQVYTASITQNTTVYAEAYNTTTGCFSTTRTPVTLRVNNIYADGPGGVGSTDGNSDLTFWVDPASIVGTTTVATWTDKSGKGTNATAATGREPARASTILNGYDVIRSNGTNAATPATGDDVMVTADYMATGFSSGSSDSRKLVSSNPATYPSVSSAAYSIFHVARFNGQNGSSAGRIIASNNNGGINWLHGFHATPGVNCFYAGNWVGTTCGTASGGGVVTTWQLHSGDGNRYWSRLTNNGNLAYQSNCTNLSPGGLSIGGWSNTGNTTISECADADIAEVITFDRVLNDARKKIVENYLQAKYATATDLTTLTGDIYAGDLAANGNFDFDVAGIGREANGLHLRTRSGGLYLSSTTTDFLKENGDYVMLGRNASTTGWETSDLTPCGTSPNTSSKRLSRVWWIKTTETTANGGNVTLSFNFGDLNQGTPLATGTYRLLTRANASTLPFTAVTATPTVSGNTVSFTVNASTFSTGAQYTLGYDAEDPGAVTLNGSNYVEVTNSTDLQVGTGNFTYEMWVYPTSTVANAVYFENGNSTTAGVMLRQNTASQVGLVMNGTAYTVNYTPALNTWTHLAVVRTGATVTLWANGTSIGNFTTAGGATLNPTAAMRIGNGVSSSTGFVGMIDEFRFYNTNSTAVATNMHSNITSAVASPAFSSLKAYYKFDEPSTTGKIFDLSLSANNGTLVGTPTLTDLSPSGAVINGNAAFCASTPGTVYTIDVGDTRVGNYAWSVTGSGNSITSTASGPNVTSVTVTWGANSGTLSCVITHSNDCKTETISQLVAISGQPNITVQPTASQESCTGATVTLSTGSLSSGTGGYDYQWYFNTSATTSGATLISGASGTIPNGSSNVNYTLSTSNITTTAPAGTGVAGGPFYYYCVFTGSGGSNCNVTSGFGAVTVRAQPSITLDPVNLDICKGGSGSMVVTATGGTPTLLYEWEYDNGTILTDNTPAGVDYSGQTATTLNITTTNATPAGTTPIWVKAYATGNGCNPAYSLFADFNVYNDPTVSAPTPALQSSVCGTPLPITGSGSGGSGGSFTYNWYSNTVNNNTTGTFITSGGNSYTPLAATGTVYYYYTVSQSASGCESAASSTAQVTVNPTLTGTVVVDECMNFAIGDKYYVLVVGTGGTPPYTYPSAFYTTTSNQGLYEINAGASNTYTISDAAGCTYTTGSVTAPSGRPTDIVYTSGSGTVTVDCWVNNYDKWVTFRDAATNNAIMAINDNQNNLGLVTVDVYKDATPPVIYNNPLATNCTWIQHTAMRRHFKLNSTIAPASGVGIRLFFSEQDYQTLKADAWNNNTGYPNPDYACTELDDVYSFNQLYVTKYTGTNEDGSYLNNSPSGLYRVFGDNTTPSNPLIKGEYTGSGTGFQGIYGGSQTHHYVEMTVTEFSEFWLHGSQQSQPLPVDMIYLQADAINNSFIRLTWATAIEVNNRGFEVERSTDGQNWTQVGFVEGHNNSTVQNNYSFDDINVAAGVVYYYRLRQVDYDGAFEYTDIVSARINGEATFSVKDFVPNPTMDKTSLLVTGTKDQDITVTFYSVVGQKVLESNHQLVKGANRIEFELGKLAAGTYTAVVSSANEVYTRKVMITK
jgi:hypothetical protein